MPKRLGKAEGGGTSAKACSDSRKGRATVQPAPRSTARRERGNANFLDNRDTGLLPQRLKPHLFAIICVRPKGRTLQKKHTQGLKPSSFQPALTARLKPCPDTKPKARSHADSKAHLYLGRYGPTKQLAEKLIHLKGTAF